MGCPRRALRRRRFQTQVGTHPRVKGTVARRKGDARAKGADNRGKGTHPASRVLIIVVRVLMTRHASSLSACTAPERGNRIRTLGRGRLR